MEQDKVTRNISLGWPAEFAMFKLSLISPIIHNTFEETSKTAYCKRVCEHELRLPSGEMIHISYKTLLDWARIYKNKGFEGLMPSKRCDSGVTRVLSQEARNEICSLKERYPRMNATQIHKRLYDDDFINSSVSVRSVQRYIKREALNSARNPNVKDRKAFEETAFGNMWQADTCHMFKITENGKTRKVYCMGIIDDYSRMLVGGAMVYSDSALNFQKALKNAVKTYGAPAKLYVDNGAPYANAQLTHICGSIGTVLIHCRPRDGASKGKCERFWGTLKNRFIHCVTPEEFDSLDAFNDAFQNFIREYNITRHTAINCTPMDRYLNSQKNTRILVDEDALNDSFLNRIRRKVRNDATISIDSVQYNVKPDFIGTYVDIRFDPENMKGAYVLYNNKKYYIERTDKQANCYTKRNNTISLDYSQMQPEK